MKNKATTVKSKGLTAKIYIRHTTKNGKVYTNYQLADYSSGQRKLRSFANESGARNKAINLHIDILPVNSVTCLSDSD